MGGREFGASTKSGIAREQIAPTLEYLSGLAGVPADALIPLGSAGKKERSGDIDVAVDARVFSAEQFRAMVERLSATLGVEHYHYRAGFRTHSFAVPVAGDIRNGRVQVDFKHHNSEYLEFSHFSAEGKRSAHKGAVRTLLIASVAAALHTPGEDVELRESGKVVVDVRWGLDVNSGLKRIFRMRKMRKDGEGRKADLENVSAKDIRREFPGLEFDDRRKVIVDPNRIAAKLFGKGITAKDLESAEAVLSVIADRHPQLLKGEFPKRVAYQLGQMGLPVPKELFAPASAKIDTAPHALTASNLPRFAAEWREFRIGAGKKERVWAIAAEPDGAGFRVKEGAPGAVLRESEVIHPGEQGRPGKANYLSAAQACTNEMERRILHRRSKGYAELVNGALVRESVEVDFSKPFPRDVRTPKPEESVSEAEYRRLHDARLARVTRKYDGMGLAVVRHTYGWELYSLHGNRVTEFFPKHIEALHKTDFKVGTILKAEAIIYNPANPRCEDLSLMQKAFPIMRSARAVRADVDAGVVPEPAIVIYDILYRDGKALGNQSYDQRREHWKNFPVAKADAGLLQSAELYNVTPDNWRTVRKQLRFEGFVLVDGSCAPGKNIISFSTSVPRPKGSYKLKPLAEQDVVVYAVRKVGDVYESVFTKQRFPDYYPGTEVRHGRSGEWFYSGRVSLHGMREVIAKVDEFVKKGAIQVVADNRVGENIDVKNDQGVVAVIEFFERFPSGKFREPRFVKPARFRAEGVDYKPAAECVATILGVTPSEPEKNTVKALLAPKKLRVSTVKAFVVPADPAEGAYAG